MNNWQETVMSKEEIEDALIGKSIVASDSYHYTIAKAQAKVTGNIAFNAGRASVLDEMRAGTISLQGLADELRKAGMMKVVEFVSILGLASGTVKAEPYPILMPLREIPEWKIFLKENGLDKEER